HLGLGRPALHHLQPLLHPELPQLRLRGQRRHHLHRPVVEGRPQQPHRRGQTCCWPPARGISSARPPPYPPAVPCPRPPGARCSAVTSGAAVGPASRAGPGRCREPSGTRSPPALLGSRGLLSGPPEDRRMDRTSETALLAEPARASARAAWPWVHVGVAALTM